MLELKSVAQVRTVEPTSTSWRYLRPSDGRKRELSCRSSADADFAAMERTGIEPGDLRLANSVEASSLFVLSCPVPVSEPDR
jgi:hypothetical protein